jgi:anti-sigma B factor antagonist
MTTSPGGAARQGSASEQLAAAVSDRDFHTVYAEDGPGGVRIVVLGEVDLNSHSELNEVSAKVAAAAPGDVTVDLAEATFIDSTMLGFLAKLHTRVEANGYELTLVAPQRAVERALTVVGFDKVMRIVKTAPR